MVSSISGYFILNKKIAVGMLTKTNFGMYILICFIFFVSYLLFYNLFSYYGIIPYFKGKSKVSKLIPLFLLIILLIILSIQFINEPKIVASGANLFFWHDIPFISLFAGLSIISLIFCFFFYKEKVLKISTSKKAKLMFYLIASAVALLAGYIQYSPNILNNFYIVIHHVHAYFNSVNNVLHMIPYSGDVNSIYGHYALILAPLLKVTSYLGIKNIFYVFLIIMSIITTIAFILFAYTINTFIRNKIVASIAIIASGLTAISMRPDLYLQVQPHRMITIAIIMALIAFASKHQKRISSIMLFGYILGIVILIWSTEMGIIGLIAWASLFICLGFQHSFKQFIRNLLFHFMAAFSCFLIAYGIVNLYNLAAGGNILSLFDYTFPLMMNSYMIEALEVPLTTMISAWMLMLTLLFLFLSKGVTSTKICKKNPIIDFNSASYFALSVLGLGSFIYAINRPVYFNFDIIYPLMILLMAIIVEKSIPFVIAAYAKIKSKEIDVYEILVSGMGIITLSVLLILAIGCVSNFGINFDSRFILRDEKPVQELINKVNKEIPIGTPGLGAAVVELYSTMGRETMNYVMDYSDITLNDNKMLIYADSQLSKMKNKSLFTTKDTMLIHSTFPGYKTFMATHSLTTVWTSQGIVYEYYVPLNDN